MINNKKSNNTINKNIKSKFKMIKYITVIIQFQIIHFNATTLCSTLRSTTQIKSYPQALSFVWQVLVVVLHYNIRNIRLSLKSIRP